ncbi:MAG: sugar phosphate isomerase/epimerase [Clostridiaceae bacterium]|jgi:L-ribulose-5-phosphate 3-epimerase|nr:sugar phosphate isomerase/epimerase [Clostridiaceae bacterium]
MFKKGVITDEISQDFKIAVDLALKYKLDGVEIRSVWEKSPHELKKEDIARIQEILSDTNLKVCGISAPFFKCNIDDQKEIDEHIEILKKSMELANILGTKYVRGFTFWKSGDFDKDLDKIVSKFEKPVELLKKENIILALEFDPSVYASNAKKLVKVIEKINSPYVKGLWDPGNDIYDPDGETPYPDGYEIIKKLMVHMHLKDAVKQDDGKITGVPIGDGQVDYAGQFKALINDGYDGYVVLETHYRPKHDIDDELMALPKGSAFSYLGYEATEECLIKWQELLDKL